jgi:beta-glucosidase
VLLKNQGDVLPIASSVRKLAVVGPLADSAQDQLGPWSAAGKPAEVVTVLAGLRERAGPDRQVRHAQGCEPQGTDTGGFAQAVAVARDSDLVVAVLGETEAMSGEARSRTRLDLPGVQAQLLGALVATGKPVVLVLLNGRPLDLTLADQQAAAIVEAWFPGSLGGAALADVLFGDVNPSGRLPITFPRHVGQVPIFYAELPSGKRASERRYATRYLDERVDPLYPFGHGLSYTRFEYSKLEIEPRRLARGGSVQVSVQVRNAGARGGKEVVQLYVRDPIASRSRPVRELKGFEKLSLAAGERRTVRFALRPEQLGFHGEDGRYRVEPGEFQVFVGGSSRATLQGRFELAE